MKHRFTFPKKEHLYGKSAVENIYEQGKSFVVFPMRVVYCSVPKGEVPIRCMVVSPKKKLRHAVDRNRAKRLMREAYRRNKITLQDIVAQQDFQLHVSFVYMDTAVMTFSQIEKKMIAALNKLTEKVVQGLNRQTNTEEQL